MYQHTHGCVRQPGKSMTQGLSLEFKGTPQFDKALIQHQAYIKALQLAGVQTHVCPTVEIFPDGCFVEDTHLILPEIVVRLNPGAPSRTEEGKSLHEHLPKDRPFVALSMQNTVDGGDLLLIGRRLLVGFSKRTQEGCVPELQTLLKRFGYAVQGIKIPGLLHLKSGMTALTEKILLALPAFAQLPDVQALGEIFVIPPEEVLAANILPINQSVLMPPHCPQTRAFIEKRCPEKKILEVDTSEFNKIDGALTCLSLLW